MKLSHALVALLLFSSSLGQAQTYYAYYGTSINYAVQNRTLARIDISNGNCTIQDIGVTVGTNNDFLGFSDICHCPDGFLYGSLYYDSLSLYRINPVDAQVVSSIPLANHFGHITTMMCKSSGKLLAIREGYPNKRFVEIDPANGTEIVIETYPDNFVYGPHDLIQYDSVFYLDGISGHLRFAAENNNFEAQLFETGYCIDNFERISVMEGADCNAWLGVDSYYWNNQGTDLYMVKVDDATCDFVCHLPKAIFAIGRVGGESILNDPYCTVPIDLDRDDNSGATGGDYFSAKFNCKTNHVKIADNDAFIPTYPLLDSVWVSIVSGILDPGLEGLFMGLPPSGIAVFGSATNTILLTNQSGEASVGDFLDILKSIQYKDTAPSPSAGIREIKVSFSTAHGFPTDTATCWVEVEELPEVQVDLGPDRQVCQGTGVTLNAGNPGLSYYWAGGQTTQTISPITSGTYKVTVSHPTLCPGTDEVVVQILPVLTANINSAGAVCAGDSVAIGFLWNNPNPFALVLQNNLGLKDTLYNITAGSNFYLTPTASASYSVTQLQNGQAAACLQFPNPAFDLVVNPSPLLLQTAQICEGDSLFLAGAYQTAPGIYTSYSTLPTGCISTTQTTLSVTSPGNHTTYLQQTTCDPSQVGTFTQYLSTSYGCDSTVIAQVSLAPSITVGFDYQGTVCQGDSVGIGFLILGSGSFDVSMTDLNMGQVELLQGISNGYQYIVSPTQSTLYSPAQVVGANPGGCLAINNLISIQVNEPVFTNLSVVLCEGDSAFLANAWQTTNGTYTDSLSSVLGCDSIVSTNLLFLPSSDTVFMASQTCNPTEAGTFTQTLTNALGCDSTVITTVLLLASDTIFVTLESCDPSQAGIFTQNLTNAVGCDSTVITTVVLLASDTIIVTLESCDPSQAGIFTQNLTNAVGCDSTVITTVSLLASDTILMTSESCDPSQAGTFVQNLTNIVGCDSTVITTVTLVPSDMVMLTSTTCDPNSVGTNMDFYVNQYGCDSVVVTTLVLAPTDTVYLVSQTCDPGQVGTATQVLTNQFGCDSTVITSFVLLASDTTIVTLEGCDPSMAGSFTDLLTNQYGCDSMVITNIILLPTDTTVQDAYTCEPAEVGVVTELYTDAMGCDSVVLLFTHLLPSDSCLTDPTVDEYLIYVPNAFSPNGDGINDLLQVFAKPGQVRRVKSFQVFDRWGESVYSQFDFQPDGPDNGWDGTYRGKPLDAAVFVWFAEVEFMGGNVKMFEGDVTLTSF